MRQNTPAADPHVPLHTGAPQSVEKEPDGTTALSNGGNHGAAASATPEASARTGGNVSTVPHQAVVANSGAGADREGESPAKKRLPPWARPVGLVALAAALVYG